jgi:hypothetical protein
MMAKKKQKPLSVFEKELKKVDAEINRFKTAVGKGKALPPSKAISTKEVEKLLKKEERFLIGSLFVHKKIALLGLYFISTIICTALLAFLFGTITTFVFYLAFGIFLWWWSHQFHQKIPHPFKTVFSLGILIVFLYFFYVVFNDLLSLIVCIIYALSFVVAGVLYFYHTKNKLLEKIHQSFPRTFLVVFYSHIIALTAASLVAYLLPKVILSDSFVSILFLLFVWLTPVLFVYFFLTKFLYLRFFDRVHIKRDVSKGLAHSAVYTAAFVLVIILAYFLTAVQLVTIERSSYDSSFDDVFTTISNIGYELPEAGLGDLKVSQDVFDISKQLLDEGIEEKKRLMDLRISLEDYLSDNYFTIISHNRLAVSSIALSASEIDEVKSDLIREHNRLEEMKKEGLFDDGTTSLEEHLFLLVGNVNDEYEPYTEPVEFAMLRRRISGSLNSYSGLVSDRRLLEFNLVYHPEMSILEPGKSRFSKQFHDMVYHTVVFRDMMLFVFNTIVLNVEETLDPYPVKSLYYTADESLSSSVLRYRVLKSNNDATLALSE